MAKKKPTNVDALISKQRQKEKSQKGAGVNLARQLHDKAHDEALQEAKANHYTWGDLFGDVDESERYRAFNGVFYPDSVDDELLGKLTTAGLQFIISPFHDSDRWPDLEKPRDEWEVKEPHFHILVYYPGKMSLKTIRNELGKVGIKQVQPTRNMTGMIRYFAHLDINPDINPDDLGKVRYSVDDIRSFNGLDHMAYINASATDIHKACKELMDLIKEKDLIDFDQVLDYVNSEAPCYAWCVYDTKINQILYRYVSSRSKRINREKAFRNQIYAQQRYIHDLEMMLMRCEHFMVTASGGQIEYSDLYKDVKEKRGEFFPARASEAVLKETAKEFQEAAENEKAEKEANHD